jgi:hypothetical protein
LLGRPGVDLPQRFLARLASSQAVLRELLALGQVVLPEPRGLQALLELPSRLAHD